MMRVYKNGRIIATIVRPSPVPMIGDSLVLQGVSYRVIDREIIYTSSNDGVEINLMVV